MGSVQKQHGRLVGLLMVFLTVPMKERSVDMKKSACKKTLLFILTMFMILAVRGSVKVKAYEPATPFYGIWCQATKDINEAAVCASQLASYGYNGQVFNTADWSNLNSEPWYVVTAGMYYSESAAQSALLSVQSFYPDAYVKYSGSYQGFPADQPAQPAQTMPSQGISYTPFYGVWCEASKSYSDVGKAADDLSAQGFLAKVYATTDWSNLNTELWYVMTAGMYPTEEAALAALPHVQKFYPDAYVKYTGAYQGKAAGTVSQVQTPPGQAGAAAPFYGIWCQASKSLSEAQQYAADMTAQGFAGKVFVTTQWSNLNTELWYVVSAGVYNTQGQAEAMLPNVQVFYPDAYVKYSGSYIG